MAVAQLLSLEPEVYQRNIKALARQQPAECELIAAIELTDGVMLSEGRDGTPTFRLRDGAGRQYWLGHSSMPATSSPALLKQFGGHNTYLSAYKAARKTTRADSSHAMTIALTAKPRPD